MESEIALLTEKIDRLTALVEAQDRRFRALEELQRDAVPIVNHMIKLSIDELAEIGNEFQLEDLLYLLKRLLRNTHNLVAMLEAMEAVMGLGEEAEILGRQVFNRAVVELDRLEREGYFAFARGGWAILERIVKSFDEEDLNALGENIVTILNTIRNMTQPDIMALANNAIESMRTETPAAEKISMLRLLREMGDPRVRQGMVRLLNLLKTLADQPATSN